MSPVLLICYRTIPYIYIIYPTASSITTTNIRTVKVGEDGVDCKAESIYLFII